jgi:hypothetical protein
VVNLVKMRLLSKKRTRPKARKLQTIYLKHINIFIRTVILEGEQTYQGQDMNEG